MRAVVDTNVLVRAATRPSSPAREVVVRLGAEPHVLVLSPYIVTELIRVLNYPRVKAQAKIGDAEIETFVAALQQIAELSDPGPTELTLSRDPDDNPILQTALFASAGVLCTVDQHFRDPLVEAFCAAHSIRILTDIELLRELRE